MLRELWKTLAAAMDSWHAGKLFIEHSLTISHDSLHVIVGILLWLILGLLMRRPLSSWRPWLWLFAAILWNETVDLWIEQWPSRGMQYGESIKDLLLTMTLPTVLLMAMHFRPQLFNGGVARGR